MAAQDGSHSPAPAVIPALLSGTAVQPLLLISQKQTWPRLNLVLSTAPPNPTLLPLAHFPPFNYLVMAALTPWCIGQVVIVSTQGLGSLLKTQFNVNVFVVWHNVAQNNGRGHWAMPFQNRSVDLDRNTGVCSQAGAVERFFLRKCISRKMRGFDIFFTGKFMKPEKSSSWLERINRNEEWFNGKQAVCAWDYQQVVSLLSTRRVLAAGHCVARDSSQRTVSSFWWAWSPHDSRLVLSFTSKGEKFTAEIRKSVSWKLFLKLCVSFLILDTKSPSFAC